MMHSKDRGLWSYLGVASFKFIPVLMLAFFFTGCLANKLVIIPGGTEVIDREAFIEEISNLDVIIIGESHQSNRHHRFQLEIIEALQSTNVDLAVGFEMFKDESQGSLDLWIAGGIPKDTFKKVYYENWQAPWSKYEKILLYIRKHGIPAIALNLPRDIAREALSKKVKEGEEAKEGEEDELAKVEDVPVKADDELGEDEVEFARLLKKRAERIEELSFIECDVDAEYEEFLQEAIEAHDGVEMDYDRFCRAQMIWDTTMAKRVTEYLKTNPDKTLVVLVGGVHAWKRAMPRKFGLFSGEIEIDYISIVPEMRSGLTRHSSTEEDMDYMLLDPFMW